MIRIKTIIVRNWDVETHDVEHLRKKLAQRLGVQSSDIFFKIEEDDRTT